MGSKKGSKATIPPEQMEVSSDDVGLVSDVLEVPVAEAPEEAQVVEKIESPFEMGKTPDNLRKRVISLYGALEKIAEKVVHSPGSRRHHFKPASVVLFYGKNPVVDCAIDKGKRKAHERIRYKVTSEGFISPDGDKVTQSAIVKIAQAYLKARAK